MYFDIIFCVATLIIGIAGITDIKVNISLEVKKINDTRTEYNVFCKATQPLTHCKFKVNKMDDLKQGGTNVTRDGYTTKFKSLTKNDCGVRMTKGIFTNNDAVLVTCRVRGEKTDWTYNSIVFTSRTTSSNYSTMSIDSRYVIKHVGDTAELFFQTENTFDRCEFKPQGCSNFITTLLLGGCMKDLYEKNHTTTPSKYCGVKIKSVTELANGIILFKTDNYTSSTDFDFVRLVVARPPSKPKLFTSILVDDPVTLTAWCVVSGGRPPARVSWYLDNTPILEGTELVLDDEWALPFEDDTVIHKLTLRLDQGDNGRMVRCSAKNDEFRNPVDSLAVEINIKEMVRSPSIYYYIGLSLALILLTGVACSVFFIRQHLFDCMTLCCKKKETVSAESNMTVMRTTQPIGQQPADQYSRCTTQSDIYAGNEYAEIRESACESYLVDASGTSGKPSLTHAPAAMRVNSLYSSYDDRK